MSTITRERVEEFISNPASLVSAEESEILELARIALASLEAEPVAWMAKDTDTGEIFIRSNGSCFEGSCQPLYAAMLQSFGNSEQLNSPVIPDCSEDTKRLDWLDAQNKRLNEYHGTTYGWKFDANFQRNAMMLNDSNYPVMSVRQAIDEAIATAPQQEVK
ncbi:hypothetical protein [Enterobacter kobei]